MHELSITEHLLDRCLREAEARRGARIRTIRLCIGPLRGIVPDCIQVYLDMLAEGTAAEGARIEAEILPVRIHCLDCGQEGEITPRHLECPHCGSIRLKLLSGKEFYIKNIDIETPHEHRTEGYDHVSGNANEDS
ncbi:MAG: hydrogenase maturation nickel metallochaperone HypA [Clostridiales bacterium]|nr:hydrogenase maturation nickel metallochaperone HypA [Clostridiales bacterium]